METEINWFVDKFGKEAVNKAIDRYAGKKGFTPDFKNFWKTLEVRKKHIILSQFDPFWMELVTTQDPRLVHRIEAIK